MYGPNAEAKRRAEYDHNLHVTTGLAEVPRAVRSRVLRFAEARGWRRGEWWTRRCCRILAVTCRDVRDRILAEGGVQGANELDAVWHRLSC